MSELNLLRIKEGDSQKNLTDKVNQNFSNLLTLKGGPYGRIGSKGPEGNRGEPGPTGSYGDQGPRGSIWSVGPCQPTPTASRIGDFWLNTDLSNSIYQLGSSGSWSYYGINLKSEDLFRISGPISNSLGNSGKYGYFLSQNTPINYTVVISDNPSMESGTESSPNTIFNPQYSKFVLSVNGSDPNKNILEFTKSDYKNLSFTSGTPRFYWDQGATANRGDYGLRFSTSDRFTINIPASNLILESSTSSVSLNSLGFNFYLDSSQLFSVNTANDLYLDFNSGSALFSTKNITYSVDGFNITTSFNGYSESSDDKPPLHLISGSPTTGNLRYLYKSASNNNAFLLKVTQGSGSLFTVFGAGYVYVDKKVNSAQPSQKLTETGQGTYVSTVVNWTNIIPSISVNTNVGNYYYVNNGSDFVIEKSPSASPGERGICIWTPATGGTTGFNKGWLNLLDTQESISFKVHSSNPSSTSDCFRFVGLNTSESPGGLPSTYNMGTNEEVAFFPLGEYASSVEFTIVNINGASGGIGSTGGNRRWYKVFYSAWGGNLANTYCGVLTTSNSIV